MNIDPSPITAWFALFIAIATTVSLITAALVWSNRRFENRVTHLIKETTHPIQPGSNGDLSMTDLHKKFDAMDVKVNRIERRYEQVIESEEGQREVWHARYLADQARIRKEWTAFFIGIRHLMKHPQHEQIPLWDELTEAYIDGTIVDKFPDERSK